MKIANILTASVLAIVLVTSCSLQEDENAIQALLENSPYVGEGIAQTTNEDANTSQGPNPYFLASYTDSFPSNVDFSRRVVTPITRTYNIVVNGDSAEATITSYFHGGPSATDVGDYGFSVHNDLGDFVRPITDSAIQNVNLVNEENGWRILSLTAAHLYTVGVTNDITITQITARVNSRNYEFVINSPETYFTKDQLPTFQPDDSVEVTVSVIGDVWAFLHHGAGHKPAFGLRHHFRDPFYYDSLSGTFTRTWQISADSVSYGVRYTAIDVVSSPAIFGDSSAIYYARAWALPYIVKTADQEIPPDEE